MSSLYNLNTIVIYQHIINSLFFDFDHEAFDVIAYVANESTKTNNLRDLRFQMCAYK